MVLLLQAALSSVSDPRRALNGRFIESFGGAVGHQLFGGVLAMAPLGIEAARSKGPGGGGGAGGHCSSMCSSRDAIEAGSTVTLGDASFRSDAHGGVSVAALLTRCRYCDGVAPSAPSQIAVSSAPSAACSRTK
jgi:hypothetical protein